MTYYDHLVDELKQAKAALLRFADLDLRQLSDDDFEHVVSTFNDFYSALRAALARLRA